MNSEAIPVVIQILDKDYTVACSAEEKDGLLESAKMLNQRMLEVRDSGKVMGAERMAVMTALNVIHEVFVNEQQSARAAAEANATLRALEDKLANAIARRAPITETKNS